MLAPADEGLSGRTIGRCALRKAVLEKELSLFRNDGGLCRSLPLGGLCWRRVSDVTGGGTPRRRQSDITEAGGTWGWGRSVAGGCWAWVGGSDITEGGWTWEWGSDVTAGR